MKTVSPSKILVVDDEPDLEPLMLQRMRRYIRKGTYEFLFARSGKEALEQLNEDPEIDIVLSDINMPEMDGLAMLEQIPDINPNVRAVVVSAYGDMKNIRTAMNRGAFDFVTKPVDFRDLQITIERTLAHTQQWKEALSYRDKLVSIQNELEVASRIQRSILPSDFPDTPQFQMFGNMEAAQDVGGDFYDVIPLDRGRVGLVMADVSGKGIPAAMFMMTCRTLMKGVAIGLLNPGEVLEEVNNLLCEENETTQFVTVLYAVYDSETGSFTYASGGHDAPLLVRRDGRTELLPLTEGIALGVQSDFKYPQRKVTLDPGERVVLYTDGITEAQTEEGVLFGVEGLSNALLGTSGTEPAEATIREIFAATREYMGDAPQFDDITCLAIHRIG
ncbi:MAG: SpoIIE family protein phosphatase [bacterium]|nr:SpoIIE family protein phosphatase [Acidimicrobiia bacterium]MCY4649246.1 SpoIIE family protein phosphatase [bacterium]